MKIETYTPTEFLKPFIAGFRIIESEEGMVNRVLPTTSLTMAFRLKGTISYLHRSTQSILPASSLSGLRRSARLIRYAPDTAALIVLFKETGVTAFLKNAQYELFGESVSLDTCFPVSDVTAVEERLAGASDNKVRIAIVESFLRSRLLFKKADTLVLNAISTIYKNKGLIKINNLAGSLFISQDALEKRFRKATGATPKQFSSIVKMQSVIRLNNTNPSFLDIALESGYFDQSHFNKDFKLFTGQTPTDFFKSARYW